MTDSPPARALSPAVYGAICVITAQFLFGSTFPFNKWVMNQNVDPVALGFARSVLAAIFLFPFYWRERNDTRWTRGDWWTALYVGAGANGLAVICEYMGTNYTTASNASLIIATESLFSVFLAVLILKERLHWQTVVGGVFALGGVALVMMRDIRQFEMHAGPGLFGDMLVVVSVVLWGFYSILSKKILHHSNPIYTLFFLNCFASITLGGVSISQGTLMPLLDVDLMTGLAVVYLGLVCSGFGFLCYFTALKHLPASVVVLTLTLIPVFGVAISIVMLGESLTFTQSAGGLAILAGVAYALWPREAQKVVADEIIQP